MNDVFLNIKESKRNRIIQVAIKEFAEYGYENSSTNRMVEEMGISKGSLFKYFKTKEDLYLFIVDLAIQEVLNTIKVDIKKLPLDLIERVVLLAAVELDAYIKEPNLFKIFKDAFMDNNSELSKKLLSKYSVRAEDTFMCLMEGCDFSILKVDKATAIKALQWILEGYNKEFAKSFNMNKPIESLKEEYIKGLEEYLKVLRRGIYSEGGD
ncbi:TetR/AcrR family transcriptional regulator [Alkaliphilus serpentinus]|nr:TetR/AcrR family transcriptional regulator [Alkaliphilus serpentinus]